VNGCVPSTFGQAQFFINWAKIQLSFVFSGTDGNLVSMVRPGRRLPTRKQKRSKLKQLARKLAHKARVHKEKPARQRQKWRRRCSKRPLKRKCQHEKSAEFYYNTSDHGTPRNRSRRKYRDSHVNSSPAVTFIEKLTNGNENVSYPEPRNALQFDLEDGRVDVSQVLGSLGVTQLQYECGPGVWRALKSNASGKSVDTFQNHQHVHYRVGPRPNASSCHYGGLSQPPSISEFCQGGIIAKDLSDSY
jgi:hypothetical protein